MAVYKRSKKWSQVGKASILVAALLTVAACESSSSSTTAAPATTTTTTTTTLPPAVTCAEGSVCTVGSTGPGGGVVVYISESEFACGADLKQKCNMVELAPSRWAADLTVPSSCTFTATDTDPKCEWGLSGIESDAIKLSSLFGAGLSNTIYLKTLDTSEGTAAAMARAYRGGGLDDWALPSGMEGMAVCNYAHKSRARVTETSGCAGIGNGKWASIPEEFWMSHVVPKTGTGRASRVGLEAVYKFGTEKRSSKLAVRPVRTFLGVIASTSTTTAAPTTTTTVRATTTLAPTTTLRTCAKGGTCVVGDTGPGGGTVYFVSADGFTCGEATSSTTCHYLEVSPSNWKASTPSSANCAAPDATTASCVWGTTTPTVSTSGAVGAGRENNRQITLNVGVLNTWATVVSRAYQGGGKNDWYLPSQHELEELCKYANGKPTGNTQTACTAGTIISGFTNHTYWSSNDGGGGTAIAINFGSGAQNFEQKTSAYLIRPIRAF